MGPHDETLVQRQRTRQRRADVSQMPDCAAGGCAVNERATLLVELLTEELPPKALRRLSDAFADAIHAGLAARDLLADTSEKAAFATPRRLAGQPQTSISGLSIRRAMPGPPLATGRRAIDLRGRPLVPIRTTASGSG